MNNNLLRRSTPKTAASERQSAIQHLITFFLWAILTGGVALVGFFLADVVFAKTITVGEIAGNVIYLPLIFAVVDI